MTKEKFINIINIIINLLKKFDFSIKSLDNINKCFNEELKRLRTDHIDYYLMHMLNLLHMIRLLIKLLLSQDHMLDLLHLYLLILFRLVL